VNLGSAQLLIRWCARACPMGIAPKPLSDPIEIGWGSISQRAVMSECHSTTTLVDARMKLSATDGSPVADPTHYCCLTGALQYLTLTRPDTAYVVQQVCLFMHDPREPHLALLKRILHYVEGTQSTGLHLSAGPVDSLTTYSDADRAGCPDSRCSTLSYCVYLGDNLVSWYSKW